MVSLVLVFICLMAAFFWWLLSCFSFFLSLSSSLPCLSSFSLSFNFLVHSRACAQSFLLAFEWLESPLDSWVETGGCGAGRAEGAGILPCPQPHFTARGCVLSVERLLSDATSAGAQGCPPFSPAYLASATRVLCLNLEPEASSQRLPGPLLVFRCLWQLFHRSCDWGRGFA